MRALILLQEGQPFGPGHLLTHRAGLRGTLKAVKERYYGAKVAGLACGIKSVGVGGGKIDRGRSRIEVLEGGRLRVLHGMTEMGQGLHTVAQQTVAEATGLAASAVVEVAVCTDDELNSGMTTASRGTVLVGNALIAAGKKLKADLDGTRGDLTLLVGRTYEGEFCCDWTGQPGTDDGATVLHLSFGFATQVVILDEETGRVTTVCAAHDVGKAINPMACEGQIEGAVHMGLGYALSEKLELAGGVPVSTSLRRLGVLRAPAMPVVEVILVEQPDPHGPYGARGLGEIGLVPTAPAVAAAFYAFDGRRRTALPLAELCREATADSG
jgi:aldehyde oxidoreductase